MTGDTSHSLHPPVRVRATGRRAGPVAGGSPTAGTKLRLAETIHRHRLPLGGAVLVDAVTLAVAELGEPDAAVLDRLLVMGAPPPEAGPAVQRMLHQLLADGWLTVAGEPDGKPGGRPAGPRPDRQARERTEADGRG